MKQINKQDANKNLFKNTGIIAIGQVSTQILNFFLLPLYTSLLTTYEYGVLDLLTTYSSLLSILVGMQISQAVFRFLVTKRDNAVEIKRTISTVVIASSIICVIYLFAFVGIQGFLNIQYKWFLLIHVISVLALQTTSNIARGLGDNLKYAMANFISSLIIVVLNVIFVAIFQFGVFAMLISYILGPIIGVIYLTLKCKIYTYVKICWFEKKMFKRILKYSIPLVPNELSWTVMHSSDRWIISYFMGVAQNGLIAVASKFSLIYTTFFSIFNKSWTEQVVLHYKEEGGAEYVNEMFGKMTVLFATLAAGIISCMPFVFKFLVADQFKKSYALIPLYLCAVFFNAIIGMVSAIYLIENETKQIAMSTTVAAAINIITDLILIKRIGVYAAPVSSIMAYATISVWRMIDVNKRHCKINISLKDSMILIMLLLLSLYIFFTKQIIMRCIVFCIFLIMAIVENYDLLKDLFQSLIKSK